MIGSLRGKVIEVLGSAVLIEAAGVGYLVRVPVTALASFRVGEETFVYTHDLVREDARELFGFAKRNELELFDQLLGVSGVGPKVALAIMSGGSADTVRRHILAGDLDALTSTPGVGRKTAQKIVLELKGALVEGDEGAPQDRETREALESLGYSPQAAREALKSVSPDVVDVAARVREALKYLS